MAEERVVLAYSGDLITSAALAWLLEQGAAEVATVTVDLGQGRDLNDVRDRALGIGAMRAHVIDARDHFAREAVAPAWRLPMDQPRASALARPFIARHTLEIARIEGATAVAHGSAFPATDPAGLLAAQFIDLLWPTLLLFGLEQVRIVPGATVVTPLVFESYPVSHSLLAVIGWAVLLGASHYGSRRNIRNALILGALVVSHWLLDLIVHQPDLPLYPGSATLAGLNAWSSLPLTLLLEGSIFALGVWLYARSTTAADATGRWSLLGLVAFLLLIYAANLFGTPPPNEGAIAWAGHAQWLLVLWGYWVDGHRHAGR